jgi:hypothetical protein
MFWFKIRLVNICYLLKVNQWIEFYKESKKII